MTRIAALILADTGRDAEFAGLSLIERAVRSAVRAGATRIHVVGASPERLWVHEPTPAAVMVTFAASSEKPFADTPITDILLVLDINTIVEPRALSELAGLDDARPGEATLLVDSALDATHRFIEVVDGRVTSTFTNGNASSLDIVAMTRDAIESVRHARTLQQALDRLARLGRLRAASRRDGFVRRLRTREDVAALEASYLRQTNGGAKEGAFTRVVRRFSIPLSRRLLRTSIGANQVTLLSLDLSVAAGFFFWFGSYWAGVLGALAYYASVILDCSDGEVARARLTDSRFGAWLETATDYLSYFFVLGGIVWADSRQSGFNNHTWGALIGGAATAAIMALVGYLRARVAGTNPGALDDALASELRRGSKTQKFAAWARQLIKRPFLAHLILFQAAIGHLPTLLEIWAYGSVAALLIVISVQSHIIRSVHVEPLRAIPTR